MEFALPTIPTLVRYLLFSGPTTLQPLPLRATEVPWTIMLQVPLKPIQYGWVQIQDERLGQAIACPDDSLLAAAWTSTLPARGEKGDIVGLQEHIFEV